MVSCNTLIQLHRALKEKVEYIWVLIKQGVLGWLLELGKRSSVEAKIRHAQKRQIRNTLLTYSFHDCLKAETVFTRENEFSVKEHLKKDFSGSVPVYALNLAEYGEVLVSPLGESPSLERLMEAADA